MSETILRLCDEIEKEMDFLRTKIRNHEARFHIADIIDHYKNMIDQYCMDFKGKDEKLEFILTNVKEQFKNHSAEIISGL